MRKAGWTGLALAMGLAVAMVAGCTGSTRTSESTGEYVDDALITSKVKQAILAEPGLHAMQIGVETYKDIVQLSGFVDSSQSRTYAEKLAMNIPGVRGVENNLIIK